MSKKRKQKGGNGHFFVWGFSASLGNHNQHSCWFFGSLFLSFGFFPFYPSCQVVSKMSWAERFLPELLAAAAGGLCR
jgi:hypothetical protein